MRFQVAVFTLILLSGVARVLPAAAADLTPDAAYTLVVRAPSSKDPLPKLDALVPARKVLEAQAAREPKSARWAYALAHVAYAEAEQSTGDPAKAKRKEAVERFEKSAELQPGNADGQFWLASTCFDRINDVGTLSQMSLASDGRKAFEKAIAIDPNHVMARVGLSQFLMNAPAIAGGSVEKARAQGEALLAIPGKRGEFQGRMVLAGIAAAQENWAEMSRQLTAAETAPGEGADPAAALRTQAVLLLTKKRDPQTAAPVVARYMKLAPPDDLSALFLDGEVKRQLGHCDQALPQFEQVIAKFENARGSRWGAAICREQLGKKAEARHDYEEYARRFPADERTKEAKAAIKRLSGS